MKWSVLQYINVLVQNFVKNPLVSNSASTFDDVRLRGYTDIFSYSLHYFTLDVKPDQSPSSIVLRWALFMKHNLKFGLVWTVHEFLVLFIAIVFNI